MYLGFFLFKSCFYCEECKQLQMGKAHYLCPVSFNMPLSIRRELGLFMVSEMQYCRSRRGIWEADKLKEEEKDPGRHNTSHSDIRNSGECVWHREWCCHHDHGYGEQQSFLRPWGVVQSCCDHGRHVKMLGWQQDDPHLAFRPFILMSHLIFQIFYLKEFSCSL